MLRPDNLKGKSIIMLSRKGCPFCQQTIPVINKLANEMTYINWYIIDIEETPKLASWFNQKIDIEGVPTFVFMKDSKIIGIDSGAKTYEQMKAITKLIK